MEPYFFELPSGFRPHLFLPEKLWKYQDEARHLVATIARKQLKGSRFVRLSSLILRKTISPRRLATIIRSLEVGGVIETKSHIKGKRCRGYRLTQEWASRKVERVKAKSETLIRKIRKELVPVRERQLDRRKEIHAKLDSLQRHLTITSEADFLLEQLKPKAILGQSIQVSRIRQRRYPFSVAKTGRCYNAITSLKRVLRTALRLDGERVGCIDLSCAQPALVAFLIQLCHPSDERHSRTTYMHPSLESLLCPFCPCLPDARRMPLCPEEVAAFRNLVCGGGFYGNLAAWLPVEVSDLKRRFIVDVLAKKGPYPSPVADCFGARFPRILNFMRTINRDDHGALICILQRLESWLVCETVAPRLVSKLPFLTLHDAIFGPLSGLDIVQTAFHDAFEEIRFSLNLKRIEEFTKKPDRDARLALAA